MQKEENDVKVEMGRIKAVGHLNLVSHRHLTFCCSVLLLDYNVDILLGINLINVIERKSP